jgi:hypothetical protein
MLRYWLHKATGHRTFESEVAKARYHCFSCGKRWGRQPRWNR